MSKISIDPASLPCSPCDETNGVAYFPRMLGKIRLHATGNLWEDLRDNLGGGLDGRCVDVLGVSYVDLSARVLQGGTDEEILVWCEANGHPLNDSVKLVWRHYVNKLGWNDAVTEILARRKIESGLADRDDIVTIAHYIDVDEGRR
jgi:hypothetical protein